MTDPEIARLPRERLPEAARVLARAFDDDPVSRYLFPHPRRRRLALRGFMAATTRDALPFGEVWTALDGETLVGTAAWLPEGSFPPSAARQARLIRGALTALLTPSTVVEGLRLLARVQHLHPRDPHWYLAVIGVEPSRHGRGVGSRLLARVLDRLDREEIPAYLETSTTANVAWYGNRRFDVREEVRPCKAGPPMWTMWRTPGVSAA